MSARRAMKTEPKKPSTNPLYSQSARFDRLKAQYSGLDAYSRHKLLINNYALYYSGAEKKFERDESNDKSYHDIIRENHRFLWSDDDVERSRTSWDMQLAKKYYDRLFKEYCIVDLSQYEKNRVAMRWRTEAEVKSGKGHFVCGEKRCASDKGLDSWEANFAYREDGEKKNALVKLRLCPECSAKLNFHSAKKRAKREEKRKRKRHGDDRGDAKRPKEETRTDGEEDFREAMDDVVQDLLF